MSIFRSEVYERRKSRLHGEVILTGAASNWRLVGLLLLIVVFALLWIVTGHYARTERVIGRIVPDGALARIMPSRPGVVIRLAVKEGDAVKAGQLLATVLVQQASSDRADPSGEGLSSIDRQHQLIDQQIELSRQGQLHEATKLSATITQNRAQLAALASQINNQTRIVTSARESFEPLAEAARDGYVSKIEFELRRQQFLNAQVQLSQLYSLQAEMTGRLRQAQVSLAELPAQTNSRVNDLISGQASLVQRRIEIENARSYVVTAPISGYVSALQVRLGSAVTGEVPMMTIVSGDARMLAELYAPSRAIGFAKPGQEVRLMYDAFPYQRFGSFSGRITSISHTVLAPREVDAAIEIKEPVYRVRVNLSHQTVRAFGEAVALQPGMTLTSNIVLDRRSFLDWLLEPINAVRNRT